MNAQKKTFRYHKLFVPLLTAVCMLWALGGLVDLDGMKTAVAAPNADLCYATPDDGATEFSGADASAVQNAVNAASANATVKVAGTCAGVQFQGGLTQTAYISQNLTIQGGYTNTNWTVSDTVLYPTTLDAEGNGRVIVIPSGYNATLDGLTLTGGDSSQSGGANSYGGGIYVNGSVALTITGSALISNTAVTWGGGLYVDSGTVVLSGTQVSNNSASSGGGLYVDYGSAALSDTQVISNSASSRGGGLYVYRSSAALTMVGGEVRDNSASNNGGAVYNYDGTITSGSALTISGEVYQAGGAFAGSSYDLNIQGDLALTGGDFYAPNTPNQFILTGAFAHTASSYHQTQTVSGSSDVGFPKEGGLILNANGVDLDSTAVTITTGADCAGVPSSEAVQVTVW